VFDYGGKSLSPRARAAFIFSRPFLDTSSFTTPLQLQFKATYPLIQEYSHSTMGGEAAKERRRLKRLQAQEQKDGDAKSGSVQSKPNDGLKVDARNQPKANGEKSSADVALQRFQRKMARKASGKFKAQAQNEKSSPKQQPSPAYNNNKRNSYDGDDRKQSNHRPSKTFKGNPKRRTTPNRRQSNPRHKKDKTPTNKKKTPAKPKVKKPKHLKRKMDQLSKTIAEGSGTNTVADLEGQMKQLAEQMEQYKNVKQKGTVTQDEKSSSVVSKEDVAKDEKEIEAKGGEEDSSESSVWRCEW